MSTATHAPSDPTFPTVYEVATRLLMPGPDFSKATRSSVSIVDGIEPSQPTLQPDRVYWLGPAEISTLYLPVSRTGIAGMQRDPSQGGGPAHIRKIARLIRDGRPLPNVSVALCNGQAYVDDGGHRCCAGIMARLPIRVATRRATLDEMRFLFYGQAQARKISRDRVVLDGDGPIELYVQDALTCDSHQWSGIVAQTARSGRLSAGAMAILAGMYGCNAITAKWQTLDGSRFDTTAADELATLLRAFGNHSANQQAWTAKAVRASTIAAIHAIRRSDRPGEDAKRWVRHMPAFRFSDFAHIRDATGLADSLLAHWNKRLPSDRKVQQ